MINQITLKNLKISKRNSRETTAFTATIWIDGASLCAAHNDGSGGETFVAALNWMRPAIKAIEAANGHRLEEIVDMIVEDFLEDDENAMCEKLNAEQVLKMTPLGHCYAMINAAKGGAS